MYMHVYHVYMYKASPLHIGTHANIILCASILWNSPKFLLKQCFIFKLCYAFAKMEYSKCTGFTPGTYGFKAILTA